VSGIRLPVAAARFYPGRAAELVETVEDLLAAAHPPELSGVLRALVAPHAGYDYSGAVAATAFATLRGLDASRVALLGPSHFVPLRGVAVSGADGWETPLGTVPLDGGLREAALSADAVVDDAPHEHDHALEVELPFLQHTLGPALTVLPVAVGAGADEAAAVAAALSADALVVVSTDLSHYHDDATARTLDRRTADVVLALDAASIRDSDACGAHALRGLLLHARRAGWACTELDLRTSADAFGDTASVVGYGAFAFTAAQ
jgi:AmmeMemoRadiSam system protein B